METNAMEQRLSFVVDYESGQWSMSELCDRYQISRPTGYKWIGRIEDGLKAVVDRSRPSSSIESDTRAVEQGARLRVRYGRAPASSCRSSSAVTRPGTRPPAAP
jgi:transposase